MKAICEVSPYQAFWDSALNLHTLKFTASKLPYACSLESIMSIVLHAFLKLI